MEQQFDTKQEDTDKLGGNEAADESPEAAAAAALRQERWGKIEELSEALNEMLKRGDNAGVRALLGELMKDSIPEGLERFLRALALVGGAVSRNMALNAVLDVTRGSKGPKHTKEVLTSDLRRYTKERKDFLAACAEAEAEEAEAEAADGDAAGLPNGFYRSVGEIWFRAKGGDAFQVCPNFTVLAEGHDEESGGCTTEIEFTNRHGRVLTASVPHGALAGRSHEVREMLADKGFWVTSHPAAANAFARLIRELHSDKRMVSFRRPGLYKLGDRHAHIAPTGEATYSCPEGADRVEGFNETGLSCRTVVKDPLKRGLLEAWQDGVARVFANSKLPHVALGILTGVAGTIVDFGHLDSRAMAFVGPSSRGKSTAQAYGGSWWANPKADQGVVLTTKGTLNGLEYVFALGSGASLHLDEGANSEPKTIVGLGFNFAAEAGKKRMTASLTQRRTPEWSGFLTLSLEKPLSAVQAEAKGVPLSGAAVRMVSVSADSVEPIDPQEAAHIKQVAFDNYGHAGPKFVEALFARGYHTRPEALRGLVDGFTARLIEVAGEHPKIGTLRRAAETFAILWTVGAIAVDAEILPIERREVERAVMWGWLNFLASQEARALDTGADAADRLWLFLRSNPAKVRSLGDDTSTHAEILAWKGKYGVYYVPCVNLSKMGLPGGEGAVIKELEQRGELVRQGKNKVHERIPGLGKEKHYRLKPSPEAKANDADAEDHPGVAAFFPPVMEEEEA